MSSSSPKINTTAAPLATVAKPGSSPTSPLSKEHLEGDALISALKQQLEFYFSKQNLATDAYLLSHMNASKFVPIDVIANFRKVKMLTEDRALLVDVMKQCRNLVVDETGTNVRPNIKMERTTLILRDIPASTPIDDIKSIFASTSAPAKPINVRSDIDDTWFVTFESEDACTDTALWLPSQTFQGKSVKCRVKSENLLRGFYYPNAPKENAPITAPIPMQASPTTQWRTTGSAPYYGNGYMPYAGYPYGYPAGYVQPTGQTPPQTNTRLDGKNERRQKNTNNGAPAQPNTRKRGKGADAAAAAGSVQVVAAASGAVTVTGVVSPTAAAPAAAAAPAPGQGKKALKRAKKAAAAQAAAAAAAAATPAATAATKATPDGVPLGLDNFPALPNNPVKKASPVSGYTSTFHEYDREAMAAIVAALCKQSYPRPDTFPTDPDSAIVRKTVLTTCQLMEPFPVIYPASPSPELAAQPTHSGLAMPFLDLGVGPASAVVAGRNPYIDAHPKKKAAPATTAQPKKKAAAAANATTAANTNTTTPAASTSTTSAPAPAANGKPKSATKASKPKYQKANTSASSSSTSTSTAASTSTSTSTSTSSTPTPAATTPATPAVPVVTAASIVAANANLPVQPNPKQVAAAKKAAEEKAAREREAREKAAAAEAAKTQSKGGKPKYQPKGTKQAGQKDKEKEKGDKNKENQAIQASENKNNETKSNEPPKIKWAAKVGSVDPAVALAKIAKAKAEAEQKAKAEATSSSSSSSSSSASTSSSSTSTSSTSTSSTSTSSHSKDHSLKDKEASNSSKDAASAASPTASDDEANKKLSYAEMARRAKNAAAAAAAAAAKSNGSDATPTSPTSSRINNSSSPTSSSPSPSPSSQ